MNKEGGKSALVSDFLNERRKCVGRSRDSPKSGNKVKKLRMERCTK